MGPRTAPHNAARPSLTIPEMRGVAHPDGRQGRRQAGGRQRSVSEINAPRSPPAATLGVGIAVERHCRRELAAKVTAHTEQRALALADATPGLSRDAVSVVATMLSDKPFTSKDALVAFCGLDIAARRSGKWKGTERLSKKGNSYLRKKLFLIAWGLFMHNQEYRVYYDTLEARGIPYIARLNALARRFLRTTWWHHLQNSRAVALPVPAVLSSDAVVAVV
jgi:transposase